MKTKLQRKLALLLALCLGLLLAGCGGQEVSAQASPAQTAAPTATPSPTAASQPKGEPDKEETVYAKADASGAVTEVTVEAVLRNSGDGEDIEDRSNLSDIRNTKGDEEFTQTADGTVIWENKGEDIYYKGVSDEALPVAVSITYTMDGKTVAPEDLAGKSGRLTIRFDYTNNTAQAVKVDGEEETLSVPFLALSVAVLDGDNAYNIQVTNGKVIDLEGYAVVVGYALPGLSESLQLSDYEPAEELELPDYVEITADVVDFELELTATILSNGILEDLETEDLDSVDELVEDMDSLSEASGSLADGAGTLLDGAQTLYSYVTAYISGVSAISQGAEQLAEGIAALEEQMDQLCQGAAAVQEGLESLEAMLGQTSLPTIDGDGLSPVSAALGALAADAQALQAALSSLEETLARLQTVEAAAAAYESAVTEGVSGALSALEQVSTGGLTDTARQQARSALESALAGSDISTEDKASIENAVADAIDLSGEAAAVQGLVEQARSALSNIPALSDFAGEGLQAIANRLRALKALDAAYQTFTGLPEGKTGSVRFIIETEGIEAG